LALAGVLLAACAHDAPGTAAATPGHATMLSKPVTSQTLYGNYLAGRVAGENRETGMAAQFYAEALKQDPANDIILDRTFLLELADGQVEQALKHADEIVAHDSNKRLPELVLGLKSIKEGAYAEGRRHIAIAANGPFNSLANRLIAAWCFEGEGRTGDALAELKLIEQTGAFDLFRLLHTALIEEHAGRNAEADTTYRRVIDSGGGNALRVVQAYGRFLERQGRQADAVALYQKFGENQPDNPLITNAELRAKAGGKIEPLIATPQDGVAEVLYGLASALAADRNVDLPIVYLQMALYLRPDSDVGRTLLADLFELVERYTEANAAYADVPRSSPLALNAQIQTALNLDRLGKTDQAVAKLKALSRSKEEGLRVLISLGDLLRAHERFAEAVDAYDQAIALAPMPPTRQYWSLFYARGVSLERAGRWPDAERDLKTALALDPDQPLVLNYLGYSWIEKGQNFEEAMKMIGRAVDLLPNDGYVVDSLGWAHYRLGRYDVALTYLERAVNLRPDDPTINDHLGDAYWRTGRPLEARFQWKRAITLGAEKTIVPAIEHKIEFGLNEAGAADSSHLSRSTP
jgi:tetratricopeptide (TPR) repeat protein